jgi:hypothetical protein
VWAHLAVAGPAGDLVQVVQQLRLLLFKQLHAVRVLGSINRRLAVEAANVHLQQLNRGMHIDLCTGIPINVHLRHADVEGQGVVSTRAIGHDPAGVVTQNWGVVTPMFTCVSARRCCLERGVHVHVDQMWLQMWLTYHSW